MAFHAALPKVALVIIPKYTVSKWLRFLIYGSAIIRNYTVYVHVHYYNLYYKPKGVWWWYHI